MRATAISKMINHYRIAAEEEEDSILDYELYGCSSHVLCRYFLRS
jgi:hypothetical protein